MTHENVDDFIIRRLSIVQKSCRIKSAVGNPVDNYVTSIDKSIRLQNKNIVKVCVTSGKEELIALPRNLMDEVIKQLEQRVEKAATATTVATATRTVPVSVTTVSILTSAQRKKDEKTREKTEEMLTRHLDAFL